VVHRRNKRGNQRFLERNENENTTYQNLWDTTKAFLRGKCIAMSAYIKSTERSQINDLVLHLKLLEKALLLKSSFLFFKVSFLRLALFHVFS
jgi:hypothetical protein